MKTWINEYWWLFLLVLFSLIIIAFITGSFRMNRMIARETEILMDVNASPDSYETRTITQEDLDALPKPVGRWLETIGLVGQERLLFVEFTQNGSMRMDPETDKWMESEARQVVNVAKPAFIWHVDLSMMPIMNTKGRDLFFQGEASMDIRIGSLIRVVDEKNNEKLDESALQRFLMELPWYPTAALEEYMEWEAIDNERTKAIMTYEGMRAEAVFVFDEEGHLKSVEADRFKDPKDSIRTACVGVFHSRMVIDGLTVPDAADITWEIETGPFTWYRFESSNMVFHHEVPGND